MKTFLLVKNSFRNLENFEQNKVQHGSILTWREVPAKIIYHIETVVQLTMKLGRVTMVVSLVDEDGVSLKAFTTSCLENNLKDFGLGEELFIRPVGKESKLQKPKPKLLPPLDNAALIVLQGINTCPSWIEIMFYL